MEIVNVRRVFYPVGQGLFCSEQFDLDGQPNPVSVVYDCGCFLPSDRLKKHYHIQKTLPDYIDEDFPNRRTPILGVFISHLHYDHICGLGKLLKQCDVRNLFLPQLTPALLLESALYSKIYASEQEFQETITILQSLSEYYIRETGIIQIAPFDPENDREYEITEIDILNRISSGLIRNCKIRIGPYWEYIPFNYFTYTQKAKDLLDELQKINGMNGCFVNGVIDFSKLARALADNGTFELCKKGYKEVFKSGNEYSMPVYSGPIDMKLEYCWLECGPYHCGDCDHPFRRCYYNDCCYCRHCHLRHFLYCGCLYTGDFIASKPMYFDAMKDFYTRRGVWDRISIIQVPHHGSSNGHNMGLYEPHKCLAVISAGAKNRYNHPDPLVIRDLQRKGVPTYVLTEVDDKLENRMRYIKH